MYLKISWNNVKKNFKDYGVYFLTLMIAIALFYAFNSLGSQSAFETATSTATKNLSKQLITMMSVLSKFVAVILSFLIIYANNFLLKRRKKELGIYMLLGMENRRISSIFVTEIILVGIISFLAGITVGSVLSQGISILALRLFAFDLSSYQFSFSMTSLGNTLIAFVIIFVLVILFNVRMIRKVKLIDLMNAGRVNEQLNIKSIKVIVGIFLVGIAMLFSALWLIYKGNGLKADSPEFLISAAFVILGTGCLIYSFFTVFLSLLKRNSKWYYKNINVFVLRQISSKIQTNFVTITVVCLLLTATMVIVSTGMGMAFTLNNNADSAAPYEVSIYQELDNPKVVKGQSITDYLQEHKIKTDDYLEKKLEIHIIEDKSLQYNQVLPDTSLLWDTDKDLPQENMPIMSISDYNKILVSQGKDKIQLNDDQYIFNSCYKGTKELLANYLGKKGHITVGDQTLTPAELKVQEVIYYLSPVGANDKGTIIVSDQVAKELTPTLVVLNAHLQKGVEPESFDNQILKLIGGSDCPYKFFTKSMLNVIYYGGFALVAFVCCYMGIVFLIISVSILALQQLTETVDNVYRYQMLKNLGVDKGMCNKAILRQIVVYFGTPLLLAIIYTLVGLPKILSMVRRGLGLQIGSNVGFTLVLFLIIYGSYFVITYFSCRSILGGNIAIDKE
ncbi:ABC transporter permease [Anaeromicropila herbilytica]|uniref:ABC transporter permease n=1 Tax=Anaeromicropila herbilytica TaxID=2785025 RepID=A0A7R7EJE5_9FIRM|nr:ABC transporter permease [Anaeromicropila herbilytica]BCN29892.1 ABC transporter permease [Anaeromicropila herbilytica]